MKRKKRLMGLLVVGVVLALGGWAYVELYFKRPIGHGPAGPPVDAAAFRSPWTEQPVMLLGIGDSITAGLGARSSAHSYFERLRANPDDEWPDLQGVCLSQVLPNLTAKNLAVSGTNSLQHLTTLERLETQEEEVFGLVVMTTGGNDLIHWYGRRPPKEGAMYGASLKQAEPWIGKFKTRLDAMLDRIDAAFPGGCEIILADIYDPTDGVGDAPSVYLPHWKDGLAIHARYNKIIHEAAKQRDNVHLVPLHATFLGHGSHCRQFWRSTYVPQDPTYWFYENIEDPNDRGYDAIRRVFLNTIVERSRLAADARSKANP